MTVEEHGLKAGEEGLFAIEMIPAHLNKADFWIGEVINGSAQNIWGRNKVGIQDKDQFACAEFHAMGKGSCLES